MNGLTYERIAHIIRTQMLVTINKRAACRGNTISTLRMIESLEGSTNRIDTIPIRSLGEMNGRVRGDNKVIALKIMVR